MLALVGPPGAGKTTVGHLLAGSLGVTVTDLDALVVERAVKSISDMFVQDARTRPCTRV